MSVYLVTYDLNSPGQKHAQVVEKIKSFPSWTKLSESSYAISTDMTEVQAFDVLKPLLDKNDVLYVIALHFPYHGLGNEDVHEWLKNNLTACR